MTERQSIIFKFIKKFIAFEVKLKKLGYFKKSIKRKNVEVDWDSFQKDYARMINELVEGNKKEFQYLITHPPKKMCVKDNVITFDRTMSDDHAKELLISLRAIRNNLFHGGKFDGEELSGSERNMTLLNSAIIVLRKLESSL